MQQQKTKMNRKIKIGDTKYTVLYSPETADEIINKILEWMEDPRHYASACGEGFLQDDNCQIDAPYLIADIIDEILKPKEIK